MAEPGFDPIPQPCTGLPQGFPERWTLIPEALCDLAWRASAGIIFQARADMDKDWITGFQAGVKDQHGALLFQFPLL